MEVTVKEVGGEPQPIKLEIFNYHAANYIEIEKYDVGVYNFSYNAISWLRV